MGNRISARTIREETREWRHENEVLAGFCWLPFTRQREILSFMHCLMAVRGIEGMKAKEIKEPWPEVFERVYPLLPALEKTQVEAEIYKGKSADWERRELEERIAFKEFGNLVTVKQAKVLRYVKSLEKGIELPVLWIFDDTPYEEAFEKLFKILPQYKREWVLAELYKEG